uniref:phosphoenolpyruvate carboxykinase (ATP) n=1 Tax=Wollemia nobilis TaxID=56998 RepID=A0A0C9RXS9_9CONI
MGSTLLNRLLAAGFQSSKPVAKWHAPASALAGRRYAATATLADDEAEFQPFPREGPGISYALNWALASKKIFPKGEAYCNLKDADLVKHGATSTEPTAGSPIFARGSISLGASEISKSQFSKLLKQVTTHLSSMPKIFVHDGAVGSSPKIDAKVRVICDHPSAASPLCSILCRTPTRNISSDAFPLTVYVASGVSSTAWEYVGLGPQGNSGFIAADYERSALIVCGKAFTDMSCLKSALTAAAAQAISVRNALPLSSAWLLVHGESVVLLIAPEKMVQNCTALHKFLVSKGPGVALCPDGVATLFQSKDSQAPNLFKLPSSVVMISADSSGVMPSISKLTSGQAAYHFLAGYQNGNFVPAYESGPMSLNLVEVAKGLSSQLTNSNIPAFLVNINEGEKQLSGVEILKFVEESLLEKLSSSKGKKPSKTAVDDLKAKYANFMSGRFPDLPEDISY